MRILFVGPGNMEIPSKGWGAVETIIWQMKLNLEKLGHTVDILNKKGFYEAIKADPKSYDIVHLEYDDYIGMWVVLSKIFKFKLFVTSHYGYSAWPQKWHRSYWIIFFKMLFSPNLIVLSKDIEKVYKKFFYRGNLNVLANGVEIEEIKFIEKGEKGLICLGKIEPRKRQFQLAEEFSTQKEVELDFVGPIADNRFSTNSENVNFLGMWSREEVKEKLTDYKALILLSDGEAHALVVGEALSAGLSLIISDKVTANLDLSLPFIHVVKNEKEALKVAKKVCDDNYKYRKQIREYAKENFSYSEIVKKYIKIIS